MQFRKRPVTVEAERFFIPEFRCNVVFKPGDPPLDTVLMFMRWPIKIDEKGPFIMIDTGTGMARVSHGDWVVTGVAGEVYPCRSDVFERTYEPVLEAHVRMASAGGADVVEATESKDVGRMSGHAISQNTRRMQTFIRNEMDAESRRERLE